MKSILASILVTLLTMSPVMAINFNSIIEENSKAQSDLHFKIKETVKSSKVAAEFYSGAQKVIADHKEIIHVPMPKQFLTFAKEKTQYKASAAQNEKRLAQELKDLE